MGAGSFVQGLTGFGFALTSVLFLSLIVSPQLAVGIVAILAPIQVVYNWLLHRADVEYGKTLVLICIAIVFLPLGALALYSLPEHVVMALLGICTIGIVIMNRSFQDASRAVLAKPVVGYGVASLAGMVGGAFAAPGPILVAYLYGADSSRKRAKANAQYALSVVGLVILVIHTVSGTVTRTLLLSSMVYVPLVLACTWLGSWTARRLSTAMFVRITDVALVTVGAYFLIRSLFHILTAGST